MSEPCSSPQLHWELFTHSNWYHGILTVGELLHRADRYGEVMSCDQTGVLNATRECGKARIRLNKRIRARGWD